MIANGIHQSKILLFYSGDYYNSIIPHKFYEEYSKYFRVKQKEYKIKAKSKLTEI